MENRIRKKSTAITANNATQKKKKKEIYCIHQAFNAKKKLGKFLNSTSIKLIMMATSMIKQEMKDDCCIPA